MARIKMVASTSGFVVLLAVLLTYLQGASSSVTPLKASNDDASVAFGVKRDPASAFYAEDIYARNNNNASAADSYPDLLEATISQLQAGLTRGDFTSVDLVKAYLARIEEVNIHGPGLRAIIETSPVALDKAAFFDAERAAGKTRGPLHGIPIVIKDNVATDVSLGMNTTAGSYTLLNSIVPGDSPSISTLRKAGAVILGKANMSVWAQARGLQNQTQGYSPRGGFGTSAYWPAGNPCSSSSGSAVAVAAGLAAASVGSQTSGSIICPASYNNIVGIKPTVGLISRNGVIPISSTQDSAGPFGRTVQDVAVLLTAMAHHGRDEGDNATWTQPAEVQKGIDYSAAPHFHNQLDNPLRGLRLGYSGETFFANRSIQNFDESVLSAYRNSIDTLRGLGAEMVEVTLDCIGDETDPTRTAFYNTSNPGGDVLFQTEMRYGLEAYISKLTSVPSAVFDLGGIVYFGIANPTLELAGNQTDQGYLIAALHTRPNSTFEAYREQGLMLARQRGIDGALARYGVSAIVSPSGGDWPLYPISDRAQYPVIGVPMGFYANDTQVGDTFPYYPYPRAPTGITFTSQKWSEPLLLRIAHAYEQATHVRSQRKPYAAARAKSQIKDIVPPPAQ
ncbi:glutamyl-tRNA amidotransferase subunit A [Pseudozyma hubeiensis SY62]|uniref:Glutamyl-tRNA amidotransferase subunit A n=1 Tax=Pseudozyma hubeiensis (strain SY62) TaxID=1305764 RepID=R9NZB6_PSEHS|nr:glutamyl-tRNA amidotransferase subunit A [Pseudozyma hubeiensis SY62]GAC94042.1 glutamyl-tRNA amidotransferase subunit A [Pseudozyma hubeiensis SY62]